MTTYWVLGKYTSEGTIGFLLRLPVDSILDHEGKSESMLTEKAKKGSKVSKGKSRPVSQNKSDSQAHRQHGKASIAIGKSLQSSRSSKPTDLHSVKGEPKRHSNKKSRSSEAGSMPTPKIEDKVDHSKTGSAPVAITGSAVENETEIDVDVEVAAVEKLAQRKSTDPGSKTHSADNTEESAPHENSDVESKEVSLQWVPFTGTAPGPVPTPYRPPDYDELEREIERKKDGSPPIFQLKEGYHF